MIDPARLLGFAFANADLLFEIDRSGRVLFATGAMKEFTRDGGDLTGDASRLFEPGDGVKFLSSMRALGNGSRMGPLKLKLVGGTDVLLSACHLPQNGDIVSCTLSRPGMRQSLASADAATGLAGRESFLQAAVNAAGNDDTLLLLDIVDLPGACEKMPPRQSGDLLRRIGEAVMSTGTKAGGRLTKSIFGAVGKNKTNLADAIRKAVRTSGADLPEITQMLVPLKGAGLSAEQRMLAVHYVVGKFADGKRDGKTGGDLSVIFEEMITETQDRAVALTKTVAHGAFKFTFQPIADLKTGICVHAEALARFTGTHNTGETVSFAEALGISDAFDLAVAAKVIDEAERAPDAKLSFNVSGRSIISPMTFGLIAGLLARKRALAPRLYVEITETAEISDLQTANKAIQALREMGFRVGLDDFGAGAASFQYLHAFTVDFVKFDGALIRRLGASPREDMMLAGMVKLCGELGAQTIAEYIETAELMNRARDMGFDLGQGYFLGEATARPPDMSEPVAQLAKRKGVKESWG